MRALAMLLLLATATGALFEWGGPAGRGARALKERRYREAIAGLRAGRSDLPRSAARRFDEALAYRGLAMPESARAAYVEATTLEGAAGRTAASFNLGNEAMREQRYREAAAWYREALRSSHADRDAKASLEEAIRRSRGEPPASPSSQSPQRQHPDGRKDQETSPESRSSPDSAGRDSSRANPPSARGEFTREEAERWLEALESQRRSAKQESKNRHAADRGDRDW